MKKSALILLILVLSFIIFEASKKVWVDLNLNLLERKIKVKSFVDEPWMESLLLKLQRFSPRDPEVWSLSGKYYLKKAGKVVAPKDRLFWINEAYRCALNAFTCNPFDRFSRAFVNKTLRWRDVLSKIVS